MMRRVNLGPTSGDMSGAIAILQKAHEEDSWKVLDYSVSELMESAPSIVAVAGF